MIDMRNSITSRYLSVLPLILFHGALVMFMTGLYRIRVYPLIAAIYPDLKLNGFFEYLYLSIHRDSVVILLAILASAFFAMALSGFRRTLFTAAGALSVLFIFSCCSASTFSGFTRLPSRPISRAGSISPACRTCSIPPRQSFPAAFTFFSFSCRPVDCRACHSLSPEPGSLLRTSGPRGHEPHARWRIFNSADGHCVSFHLPGNRRVSFPRTF